MERIDKILDEVGRRKNANDPVRKAQQELAPVREWAVQSEKDFVAAVNKLQPRINKARERLSRISALTHGELPDTLKHPLDEVNKSIGGTPKSFQEIVRMIDDLSPADIDQPNYMAPLYQKRDHPPGTIGSFTAALECLEETIKDYSARFEQGNVSLPLTGERIEPERPVGLRVESDFSVFDRH